MPDRRNEIVDLFVRDLDRIELPPRDRWRPAQRKGSSFVKTSRYVLYAGGVTAVLIAALIVGFGLRDRNSQATASPSPTLAVTNAIPTATGTPVAAPVVTAAPLGDLAALSQVRATIRYDMNPDGSRPDLARGQTAEVEVTYVRDVGYRMRILASSGRLPNGRVAGSVIDRDPRVGLQELGWSSPYPNWQGICERGGSEVLADATIAGRAASHLRCGDLYGGFWELWIDRQSGFMLKFQGALPMDDYRLGTSARGGFEVTRIEYTFDVDAAMFVLTWPPSPAPPGARDAVASADPYTQTSFLRRGEVAPLWSGPLIDGSTFHLESARGRPLLVLFWADWCPRGDPACDVLRQFDEVSRRYAGRAGFVSVDINGTASEARKIMSALGYQFPVVDDRDRSQGVSRAWGVQSFPVWVLLDRDGRVVEVRTKPQTVEQLEVMLRGVGL